jgi:hypothetical protein
MIFILEALFKFFLTLLESPTCHVGFTDRFYLLQPILLAQLIERIINVVKPLAELPPGEHLDYSIKLSDVAED